MGDKDAATRKILFSCLLTGIIIAVGDFKILSFFKSNAWVLKGDVYYLFRICGSMWTWLLISVSMALAFPRSDSASPLRAQAFDLKKDRILKSPTAMIIPANKQGNNIFLIAASWLPIYLDLSVLIQSLFRTERFIDFPLE